MDNYREADDAIAALQLRSVTGGPLRSFLFNPIIFISLATTGLWLLILVAIALAWG